MNNKIINILLITILTISGWQLLETKAQIKSGKPKYLNNPIYERRVELFKLSKIKKVDIVMLGNSLTEGGNWEDLLGRSVANRGITGDILEGYIPRMKYVYNLHPKVCFIEGGINDIYNWTPVKTIYDNYVIVIEGLKKRNIIPVIQSTLHTAKNWGEAWIRDHSPDLTPEEVNRERNKQVDMLNALLRNYARKNNIIFIDLNKKMSSGGFLKQHLTWDGAHLKANAYKIWAEEINKVLKKLKI